MKKILTILVLIFSLQSWTNADDIRDFEIEGISVGDSLLDFKSKEYILKRLKNDNTFFYKNNRYAILGLSINSKNYDWISATINPNDKKYIIHAIEGRLFFPNDIEGCLNKKKEISKEIFSIFPKKEIKNYKAKHGYDKSGKSLYYTSYIEFLYADTIEIICFDWSDELTKSKNFENELKVMITDSELNKWIATEAYN